MEVAKMAKIKENHLVKKQNVLNEIRANNMTLQELRFFSIYLSKINPQDLETRIVRFKMDDFRAVMELESRIKIDYMKRVTDSLLCKIVNVPTGRGGYMAFQLFKECLVDVDDNGEWFVEIDAHDKALPLMFEFKGKYFSYKLWNALRLKSPNQLRMYEILKQYEKIGERDLSVKELRELLGIDEKQYPQWERFRVRVLDACQQALAEQTDIKFTYTPHGKKGKGGKILALKFIIEKNKDYKDQICLEEFIQTMKDEAEEKTEQEKEKDKGSKTAEIVGVYRGLDCGEKFGKLSDDEILELNQRAFDYLMNASRTDELGLLDQAAYVGKQALYTNSKKPKNFYSYLVKAVGKNYAEA